MIAHDVITRSREFRRFRLTKVLPLVLSGCLFVPVSFFEAASQLPNGRPSPIQVPLLTTPTTIQLTRKDREDIVRGNVDVEKLSRLAANAARRLVNEPLDATALWLWSVTQKPARSRQALDLAQKISLRETTVQLQLMRNKALAGDLPGSFAHLDNALLVSEASGLPVLRAIVKGLDQPKLINLLKPYGSRPWYKLLVEQAVFYAPRAENAAEILMQTELSAVDLPPELLTSLLSRLVVEGKFNEAKIVGKRFSGLQESSLKSFGLTPDTMAADAVPLTWAFSEDAGLIGRLVPNGVLLDIERGLGGTLMTRVTSFPAGSYILRQTIEASTPDLSVRWELQCLTGKDFKTAWSQGIPAVTQKQVFDTKVTIQTNCSVQRWELLAFSESGNRRASLSVTTLDLLHN